MSSTFNGLRLYTRSDGSLGVTLFREGMGTELAPSEADKARALGFYDLDMNPVADPAPQAGQEHSP